MTVGSARDLRGETARAPRRRFRLLDAILLVAAAAAACALGRAIDHASDGDISWTALGELWQRTRPDWDGAAVPLDTMSFLALAGLKVAELSQPFAIMGALAMIPIRLLGPRPRGVRLSRQPGFMASCAVVLTTGFLSLQYSIALMFSGTELVTWWFPPVDMAPYSMFVVGLAISASWMVLIVNRRWRPERSWVDRLGRVFGAYWIVIALVVPSLVLYESTCCRGFNARSIQVPVNGTK